MRTFYAPGEVAIEPPTYNRKAQPIQDTREALPGPGPKKRPQARQKWEKPQRQPKARKGEPKGKGKCAEKFRYNKQGHQKHEGNEICHSHNHEFGACANAAPGSTCPSGRLHICCYCLDRGTRAPVASRHLGDSLRPLALTEVDPQPSGSAPDM